MTNDQVSKLEIGTRIEFPNGQQAEVTGVDSGDRTITLAYTPSPLVITPDPYAPFQAMRASIESGPIEPEYNPKMSAQAEMEAKETIARCRWIELASASII